MAGKQGCKESVQRAKAPEQKLCERKLLEHKLRESENRFNTIFHTVSDGILLTDRETRKFYFANQTMCRMLGYSEQKIKTLHVEDIHPQTDLPHILHEFETLASKQSGCACAIPVKRKDGSIFYADVSCCTLVMNGRTYLMGTFRDITSFYETDKKYRHLFEYLIDAAFLADTETGIVLDANKKAEELLGRSRAEIIGMHQTALHPPDKAGLYRQKFLDHIAMGKAFDLDAEIVSKDGSIVPVMISGSVFEYSEKKLILSLFRNITDKKLNEQRLQTYAAQLEDANRALKVLLARTQEDRREIEEKVLCNMQKLVMPLIENLKKNNSRGQHTEYINRLEANLREIVSPFARRLSSQYTFFTPSELQIAALIKEGRSTKEIAACMSLSKQTIEFHRKNIRKKLGLQNKKANLIAYLSSLQT